MLAIGLTGGIGSGKSAVADLFAKKNVPVIDADQIAHTLTQPGGSAYDELRQWLGEDYFDTEGLLKRHKLRETAFSDRDILKQLEGLLHPLVEATIREQLNELQNLGYSYAIVSIPLLIEAGMQHLVDRILVVDCPVELQLHRVSHRDQVTERSIQSILDRQAERATRLACADDIIDNSGNRVELQSQVDKLDRAYRKLAQQNA
jgi:dephospho-CoA kinase